MGEAYSCDRCGEFFRDLQGRREYQIRRDVLKNSMTSTIKYKRKDLCRDCYKSLTAWYKGED